jgi:predicted PurR-regulated permease PerM
MTSTRPVIKWTIFLAATVFVLYLCFRVLAPFTGVITWAGVLATGFYPVHKRMVRESGRKTLSALISTLLVVLVILLPLAIVASVAVDQFLDLRENLQQGAAVDGGSTVRQAAEWVAARLRLDPEAVSAWVLQNANNVARVGAEYSVSLATGIIGGVATFIFTVFVTFLLFRDGDRLVAEVPRWLPFDRDRSERLLLRIREVIYGSVYGIVVIALTQGALAGLAFWVLGVPSPLVWGMMTVVTSVIPLVGSAGVWVPCAIYLAVVGRWPQALMLVGWGVLVISMVDNFLRPRLVGGRVGLSELVMFFALLGGLRVFGPIGIVLGPVVFAVAVSILQVLRDGEEVLDENAST